MRGKRVLLYFMLFSVIMLSLLSRGVALESKPHLSQADTEYVFERDILFNETELSVFNQTFNLRNMTSFTQTYNASYTFTNELNGTAGTNITFVDNAILGADTTAFVIDNHDGHDKVIELFDDNNAGSVLIENVFEASQVSGTIELFWKESDTAKLTHIFVQNGGTTSIYVQMDNNKMSYFDGSLHDFIDPITNGWFHIRIDFECGAGGYLGLASDTYFVTANGEQFGPFAFWNNAVNLDRLEFLTSTGDDDFFTYVDAVGYSWLSNYTISENIAPTIITDTTLLEVDRYEFAYDDKEAPLVLYAVGADDVGDWEDIEQGGGDKVNIFAKPTLQIDRVVHMSDDQITTGRGLNLDNINVTSTDFLNVSFGITFLDLNGGATAGTNFFVFSADGTQLMNLAFIADGDLEIIGVGTLRNDITTDKFYEINLFFDYEIDAILMMYSVNGTHTATYHFPMATTGKFGMKQLRINSGSQLANLNTWLLDYVGIYSNGSAHHVDEIKHEQGIATVGLGSAWNFENHNLVSITAGGSLSLGALPPQPDPIFWNVAEYQIISQLLAYSINESRNFNVYTSFISSIPNAQLVVSMLKSGNAVDVLSVRGVILRQGINEFPLVYTSGFRNDPNLDFFDVDASNKLQFQMGALHDGDLEFIQASFDITDISSDGRAVSFTSAIDDNAIGNFRVKFTSISNIIPIPIIETTTRVVLTQNVTITDFIILITDNNIDTITGDTSGFISEIKLLFSTNIDVSIITTALIEMMIPLIIIVIPTIALSKITGKVGIIPLFFLFSLICVMTTIIPVWLFLIIAISMGVFISMGLSEEVV